MKKIFLLIIIYSLLNSALIAEIEQSKQIDLPKIPIKIEGDNLNFSNNTIFSEIYHIDDSFFNLNVKYNSTQYKTSYSSNLGVYIILYSFVWALCGYYIDYSIAKGEADKHWDDNNWEETTDESRYLKFTFTTIGALLGIPTGMGLSNKGKSPYQDTYTLELYNNRKLLNTKTFKVPYKENISHKYASNFLIESDKMISSYNKLYLSVSNYNRNSNFSDMNLLYDEKLSKLYNPKGEFETTQQYKERIATEKIIEQEINAEYMQKIKIKEEQEQVRKLKLFSNIELGIREIEFNKIYNYTVSNYDADKQNFNFNIAKTNKKIIIPRIKAPEFKCNINDYVVQKIFKPTLQGNWETLSDDFVLLNNKTNEIIPWEGELPTFAIAAVEYPPFLSASIKLIEPTGEGYLDSEETAIIQVILTNTGKGSAKMTRISLFQEEGPTLYYDVSNTIKEILPNNTSIAEFQLTVPENIEDDNVKFKISFLEEQGYEPAPLTFTAETREMPKPELRFIDFGVDDTSGDGKISKGETVDITIRIQNVGQGNAKQATLYLLEDRIDNVFIISEKHFELGDLISGESKDITFSISTNNRVNDVIYISFNIQEERPQFSINEKITLEIEKTQKQLEQIVFVGKDIEKKIEYSNDISIDIEKNIPKSKKSNKNALAIIFGIENYRNVSNVNFAYRDATIIMEYFSKTIGIPGEQIYFRANDEVTLGEFRKIFSDKGWLDKRVIENETDIYFYYAGHGAPAIKEKQAFLIPVDGDPNYPVLTGYSLETVYDNLSSLNANSVTVFLDACFTGANRENEMLLADARPVSIQLKNNYVNNVTVFSATSSNEISSSYPKNKHGLFSYFLMKGMQGEADSNKDNKLTINELYEYTKKNVSRTAGTLDREQTPQLECLEPEKIIINY